VLNALQNIAIVLVKPQFAGNVGSVGRAMKNMGLSRLILVSPAQDPLSAEAKMMATSAKDILEKAEIFSRQKDALAGFRWIAGTSARKGRNRGPFISPREICPKIIGHARSIPVAVLFGPEDRGLTNEELAPCQALISMPTHPQLPSLNLAQAVMIVCYELHMAALAYQAGGACAPGPFPKMAEFQKIEGMYAHLEDLLLRIGFLDPKNPKRIMHTLRRMFGRANLCDRDVAILRGIFRQLEWYAAHQAKKRSLRIRNFCGIFFGCLEKRGRLHGRKLIAKLLELPLGRIKTPFGLF
jgi:tRNA/rRNA methyltransferase